MKNLLHKAGHPVGIQFRKHKQNAGYVFRVEAGTHSTEFGADPNNLPECYEKAIDRRLSYLGLSDDAEAFQTLASAYGAFLTHYGIEFKPVTSLEFNITKGK